MTSSKKHLKFKKNNIKILSNLKNKKYNFEPTYYNVIKESLKNDR